MSRLKLSSQGFSASHPRSAPVDTEHAPVAGLSLFPPISPWWFLALLAFITVPFLGSSDFNTRGEGREALVVRSILDSGDWILPRGYGGVVPSKPILLHWAAAALSLVFGEMSEFALRLPSVIFALGACALFVAVLRRWYGDATVLLFAGLLSLSFEWFRASIAMRVDMVHSATLSCGLLACFLALRSGSIHWWISATLLICCSVLAKGPVALVISALALGTWALTEYESWPERGATLCKSYLMIACAGSLSAAWYVAAYLHAPAEFVSTVWFENVTRFTGSSAVSVPHRHSAFYLIGMLLLGTLPWSPFVLVAACKKTSLSLAGLAASWALARPVLRFSWICAVTIIAFYCAPSGKRSVYVLAAYPFLALIAARILESAPRCRGWAIAASQFMFLACLTGIAVVMPFSISPRNTERQLAEFVRRLHSPGRLVYSYGFEFYGAAYYSGVPFRRIEDTFGTRENPAIGSTILVPADEQTELDALLMEHGRSSQKIAELPVAGRAVRLLEVTPRGAPDPAGTR